MAGIGYAELLSILQEHPEIIDTLTRAGQVTPQNEIMAGMQKQAHQNAGMEMPAGTQSLGWDKFGSILGARSPVDTIGSGFQKGLGMVQQYTLPHQMLANLENERQGGSALMNAIAARLRAGKTQDMANPVATTPGLGLDLRTGQTGTPATPGLGLDLRSLLGGQ